MTFLIFALVAFIIIFIIAYRKNSGQNVYKYISQQATSIYDKYAPYSFKVVRAKVKELGQEYTPRQYVLQASVFAVGVFVITYMYFYNVLVALMYAILSIFVIPYLTYLRCNRVYSEFIFEQIQVYTTNTIMEFNTTQSFVKSLEGVYESGVLENPVKDDVKMMIDLAYENGTIEESISYFNNKYDYYIVKNMHQLFTQITNEGSKNSSGALENMSLDIDMLVENVYRDRIDRATFHKKFLQFGFMLYFMVMLVQLLLGNETYINMLNLWYIQVILHAIVIMNTAFLLNGEKYYNENVGAE